MTIYHPPDLTGATAPALSTTSDMPKAPEVPEPERASPKPAAETGEADRAQAAARARQEEADARERERDARFDRALAGLERTTLRTEAKVTTEPSEPRPKRSDFDDRDSFDDALVAWSAKSASKATKAEIERRREGEAQERSHQAARAEWQKRLDAWANVAEKAEAKYSDFRAVAEADDVQVTTAMARAILEENLDNGQGFEISYYLGKHKDEAAKIAALPEARQSIAIGRLAERLAREQKSSPKAARPKSEESRVERRESRREESMDEYAARRNKELQARAAHG